MLFQTVSGSRFSTQPWHGKLARRGITSRLVRLCGGTSERQKSSKTTRTSAHGWVAAAASMTTTVATPTLPPSASRTFASWWSYARSQGLDSMQFTEHYDCACGEEGPSSVTSNRLCPTEIVDINGQGRGCPSQSYKAGWAASQVCSCDNTETYMNCRGFGIR